MVRELLACALVAPLLGTLAMRLLADRVGARIAVVACTATACLLALGTALALFASSVHTTKTIVRTGRQGWSSDAWRDAVDEELWLSGPGALAAMGFTFSATRAWRRQRTARRAAADEAAALPGAEVVVVVPGRHPDAFTLPGAPGRIVVTEGLRAALSTDQLDVVLAHERAHLDSHHHRYVDAARLAAAGQPLLRPVARMVEYGVERWADERAALEVGDRARVAHTIGTVALVTAAAAEKSGRPRPPARAGAAGPGEERRRGGRAATGPAVTGRPAHFPDRPGHPSARAAPRALRITAPDVPATARRLAGVVPWRRLHQPRPGPVPRRVRALLRPRPGGTYSSLLIVPLIVSLSSCLWAGNVVYDPHTPLRTALTLRQI
jgi:Zn-dependent protease with chaperone function